MYTYIYVCVWCVGMCMRMCDVCAHACVCVMCVHMTRMRDVYVRMCDVCVYAYVLCVCVHAGRPPVPFDVLSIDIGSAPQTMSPSIATQAGTASQMEPAERRDQEGWPILSSPYVLSNFSIIALVFSMDAIMVAI